MIIKANEEYLKKCLKKQKLKLKDLARLSGINYGTIRNICGNSQGVSFDKARIIADILKGAASKLFYIEFESLEERSFYKRIAKVIKED